MIEHLKGRPCSIVRTPDGITGQTLLPAPRHAGLLRSARAGQGERRQASPTCRSTGSRGWRPSAQIGGTELHPWNCQPGKPELPGRLVFDLDPAPDVTFDEVVGAALEVRKRLEALGLTTFCKTTGGKGLHVVTPLTSDAREPRLGCRQDVRPGDLPAAGRGRAGSLRAQHGQEGARRPHLPRLSAQRPHRDGRGAAVAARPRGRHGLDAAELARR